MKSKNCRKNYSKRWQKAYLIPKLGLLHFFEPSVAPRRLYAGGGARLEAPVESPNQQAWNSSKRSALKMVA